MKKFPHRSEKKLYHWWAAEKKEAKEKGSDECNSKGWMDGWNVGPEEKGPKVQYNMHPSYIFFVCVLVGE